MLLSGTCQEQCGPHEAGRCKLGSVFLRQHDGEQAVAFVGIDGVFGSGGAGGVGVTVDFPKDLAAAVASDRAEVALTVRVVVLGET